MQGKIHTPWCSRRPLNSHNHVEECQIKLFQKTSTEHKPPDDAKDVTTIKPHIDMIKTLTPKDHIAIYWDH